MISTATIAIVDTGRTLAGDKGFSHVMGHPKPQSAAALQPCGLALKRKDVANGK